MVCAAMLSSGVCALSRCRTRLSRRAADMGIYFDPTDESAYLVRSVGNQFAGISRLTSDFTNTTGARAQAIRRRYDGALVHGLPTLARVTAGITSSGPRIEGQAIFRNTSGQLFLWGSHLTGWAPNDALLSVANGTSLPFATWSSVGNPSGDSTTWDSQSTFVLPYVHADGHTTYIYMVRVA